MNLIYAIFRKIKILNLIFLLSLFSILSFGKNFNINDTIFPIKTIYPYEISENTKINFPLLQACPIGDVNGDGIGDLTFSEYASDERTLCPTDKVLKSVIVTDINNIESSQIIYNYSYKPIGDYNGDGYDDVLEFSQKIIRFGCAEGISNDSLILNYPVYSNSVNDKIYYYGDINDDGKSEIFIGGECSDTLFVFSNLNTDPFVFKSGDMNLFDSQETLFNYYDYDNDGKKEFCVAFYYFPEKSYDIYWYNYDAINQKFEIENNTKIKCINKVNRDFISYFIDINGDNNLDIIHCYYKNPGLNLEVISGKKEFPYFNETTEIEVGNSNRHLYCVGDINNDGYNDWFSKTNLDTIVMYFGNKNTLTEGFDKKYFPTENNQILSPIGDYTYIPFIINPSEIFYYNDDTIPDLLLNYWSLDKNLQYDSIGTAIICGNKNFSLKNHKSLAKSKYKTYENIKYGHKTKSLGDINNDGFQDWGTLAFKGCYAEIFFGKEILEYKPDVKIFLPQKGDLKCFDWTSGDINGDGLNEIIISNSTDFNIRFSYPLFNMVNNIYIFKGRKDWPEELNYQDAELVLKDPKNFLEFGNNMTVVGDYNADGYNDLVVGGINVSCLREAYVYFGGEKISSEPNIIISEPGIFYYNKFATPITACGDVNADGYDDFTLGDPDYEQGQSLVYFGGPSADSLYDLALVNPNPNGKKFGSATAKIKGDYDDDGYPDIIQYEALLKTIYVYKGGPDFDENYDYTLTDDTLNGNCIEYLNGFSGDKKSDIIISSNNGNYNLLIFKSDTVNKQKADNILKNLFGTDAAAIASNDFDNNGYCDIFVGTPYNPTPGSIYGGIIQHYYSPFPNAINESVSDNNNLFVFPLPASSELNIKFNLDNKNQIFLNLIDINGKILKSKNYDCKIGENLIKLNIENLLNGIYFLQFQSENFITSKKIIINK